MSNNNELKTNLDILFENLEDLINEINVAPVSKDSALDPNIVFEKSFEDENEGKEEKVRQKTENFLVALKKVQFRGNVLQYSHISAKVFTKKHVFDGVEAISHKILTTGEDFFSVMFLEDPELERRFYKIIDHIQLANFQIGEISQHSRMESEKLLNEIANSKTELKNLEKEITQSKIELDKIEKLGKKLNNNEKKTTEIMEEFSKVYVQFVTILGIFTAIVVSVFGGLSILSGLFENLNEVPIWKTVLVGSLVSLFVLCLLFLLTRWISNLVKDVYKRDTESNFMQVITNNGAFATGIFIFCYLIIAAVVFSSNEARTTFISLITSLDSIPILVLLSFPIVAGIGVFIKTVDLRKYK